MGIALPGGMTDEINYRPAVNAADAIQHIRNGGRAFVSTPFRMTLIDGKCLTKFEKAGHTLLMDAKDGKGIRMMSGRSYVYLLAGQLMLEVR